MCLMAHIHTCLCEYELKRNGGKKCDKYVAWGACSIMFPLHPLIALFSLYIALYFFYDLYA